MWTARGPLKCNQLQHVAASCALVSKVPKIILIWRTAEGREDRPHPWEVWTSIAIWTFTGCTALPQLVLVLLAKKKGRRWRMLPWVSTACQSPAHGASQQHHGVGTLVVLAPRQPPLGQSLLAGSPLKVALKPKVPFCCSLCCLLGGASCNTVYNRKPVVNHASDKRNIYFMPCWLWCAAELRR